MTSITTSSNLILRTHDATYKKCVIHVIVNIKVVWRLKNKSKHLKVKQLKSSKDTVKSNITSLKCLHLFCLVR